MLDNPYWCRGDLLTVPQGREPEHASYTKKQPAPYVPFKSFQTALEVLEQALPAKMDRSVWPTFSYSLTDAHDERL